MLATDKAHALLAVGLTDDAISELGRAIASFRRQRLDQDLARPSWAWPAALAARKPVLARRWAAPRSAFPPSGQRRLRYVAELIRLRSRFRGAAGRVGPIADEAMLADRLRGCGLGNDADLAELLAARAMVAAGRAR